MIYNGVKFMKRDELASLAFYKNQIVVVERSVKSRFLQHIYNGLVSDRMGPIAKKIKEDIDGV